MGIEKGYRTSTLKKEIADAFIDNHIKEAEILLWQNDNGKRIISKAKINDIDFDTNSIFLTPCSDQDRAICQTFKPDIPYYLQSDLKKVLLKQDQSPIRFIKGVLKIKIPTEIKLEEKRQDPRISFSNSVRPVNAEINVAGRVGVSSKMIVVNLNDISSTGISFFMDSKYGQLVFENDQIKINTLGKQQLPKRIPVEVVYVKKENDKLNRIKIGGRFLEKLDPDILNGI